MTVNCVLQQYPATRSVFEQLFVNISFEGLDCLDEVAWRHGMEARELLGQLEQAISERPAACEGVSAVAYGHDDVRHRPPGGPAVG